MTPSAPPAQLRRADRHALGVFLGMLVLFLVLLGRVAQLQTYPSKQLAQHIDERMTTAKEPGIRGEILDRRGRVLGAGIVGPHAGELIQVWCLALSRRMKIGAVASMVVPYPTLGEINKRAAGAWFTDWLFSPRTRRIVSWLYRLW